MIKKFTIPFASQGDANDIPDALQVDGKVSFTQGFSYDYERPYDDPQAKDIAREDMNGLFKAITSAVGELQTLGASEWSDTISYPKGAIIYYEKDLYISQVDDNQNKPPKNWVSITSIANDSLKKAANLSDLTDKATARNNLGLGSSATLNKTDALGTSTNLVATQKLVNDTKINLENSKQDKLTFVGDGPDVMKTGSFGLGKQVKFGEKPEGSGFGAFPGNDPNLLSRWGAYVKISAVNNDVYLSKGLDAPKDRPFTIITRSDSGVWVFEIVWSSVNTVQDKNGFLRDKSFDFIDALTTSDVTQSLGTSTSLVASQALVNSVNSKIKPNTASKSQNGWWKCGDTGLIYQWGYVEGEMPITVSFPISFPTSCTSVFLQHTGTKARSYVVTEKTQTSFKFTADTAAELGQYWFAIGY